MTVLAFTARLTDILAFGLHSLAEGLAVRDLRFADVCFHFEFAQQAVDDDLQVQLAHAGDDGLPRFVIGIGLEGRILFRQLDESHGHLFLTCLSLGLDGDLDDGFGELHLFEDDGMLFVAQRVARGRLFQADDGADIARIDHRDLFAVVRVHLQQAAYALLLLLGAVIDVGAGFQHARIGAEERELADERVCRDLERQTCERLFVRRLSSPLLRPCRG